MLDNAVPKILLNPISTDVPLTATHHADHLAIIAENTQFFLETESGRKLLSTSDILQIGPQQYQVQISTESSSQRAPAHIPVTPAQNNALAPTPTFNDTNTAEHDIWGNITKSIPAMSNAQAIQNTLPSQSQNNWYQSQNTSLHANMNDALSIDPTIQPTSVQQGIAKPKEHNILDHLGISEEAAMLPELTDDFKNQSYSELSPLDTIDELMYEQPVNQPVNHQPAALSHYRQHPARPEAIPALPAATPTSTRQQTEPKTGLIGALSKIKQIIWD